MRIVSPGFGVLFARQDAVVKFFLGVDGGQTSTVALIADDTGRVLGAGRGGPCNHVAAEESRAKFASAMKDSMTGACLQAGLDARSVSFEAACFGFSGGIADKDAYSREFIRSAKFKITIDAEIALTGATGGEPGIIVIAGTGSIAFGKNAAGCLSRAGGWGYVFGDEGGAFDIARQALRTALSMEEGWGPETRLRDVLMSATGAVSATDLMHGFYNGFDRVKIAGLAPLVDKTARAGDVVALGILRTAGRQLAKLAKNVHATLFREGDVVRVSYVGGVFESDLLTGTFGRAVQEQLGCEVSTPLFPPAAGALLEAFQMSGRRVPLSNIPVVKT